MAAILVLRKKRKARSYSRAGCLYPEPFAAARDGDAQIGAELMSKLYHQTDAETRPQQRPLSVVNTMRRRRRWRVSASRGGTSFPLDPM